MNKFQGIRINRYGTVQIAYQFHISCLEIVERMNSEILLCKF
jgi:hypothetical protein